jgi:peroxiredoxin
MEEDMPVEVGKPAPALTLADQSGRRVTVPVPGKPTVLIFYRGDW